MRVYGRFGGGVGAGIEIERLRVLAGEGERVRKIGRVGAWALVRTGLADLSWWEEGDGSFAIVDGELFGGVGAAAILQAFRREGERSFVALNGTACVLVFEAGSGRLALARDRAGFGNCFWMEGSEGLTFGSEILPLVRSDPRAELDAGAVDLFLASGFISAPWTSLAHIRKVPAGHVLIADGRGARLSRYWRASGRPQLRLGLEGRKERMERHLLQAVERQLPGRAAAAILLSGGIDSMYLAALLARHFGVRPAAFTYRYADYEGEFNETAQARAAAEHLGLEHHEMIVGPADITSTLEAMLIAHSGPLSYGAHSAILRDVAASGAQILYSGFEPDAPYSSAAEMLGQWLRSVPLPHAAIARGVERGFGTRRRWANFLAYAERVAATGLVWRFHAPLTPDPIRESLYVDRALSERAKQAAARLFGEVVAEFSTENAVVRIAGPLTALYQSEGSSRWSSCFGRAHGLLPRSPFQDNDYVDLLLRMPRSGHKREIRELAAKLLPRDLAFAPKVAQTLPIAHWLRGPMSEFITAQLSAPRIAEGGLFRHEVIMDLLRRHREGPVSHAWTLWNVLVLTLWQEIVRREAGRLCQRRV